MRLALCLLVALAAAAPASAQARFVQQCVASAEGEDMGGIDPADVCQCTADAADRRGIAASSLDALVDHVSADGDLQLESLPEGDQAVAEVVIESMLGCAFKSSLASLGEEIGAAFSEGFAMEEAVTEQSAPTDEPAPPPAAVAMPAPAAPPAVPAGFRLGDGATARQAVQAGPGGAIRIVG